VSSRTIEPNRNEKPNAAGTQQQQSKKRKAQQSGPDKSTVAQEAAPKSPKRVCFNENNSKKLNTLKKC